MCGGFRGVDSGTTNYPIINKDLDGKNTQKAWAKGDSAVVADLGEGERGGQRAHP